MSDYSYLHYQDYRDFKSYSYICVQGLQLVSRQKLKLKRLNFLQVLESQ